MKSAYLPLVSGAATLVILAIANASLAGQAKDAPTPAVTYTKDVAPILQRACQNCHRQGSIAPMSLLTYEDTRPWARSIRQKVSRREMPPWYLEKNIGIQKFKDDPSLSDAEITTLVSWVDAGAPQGDPKDLPPPRTFDDNTKWSIGKPDLIVSVPKEHVVPAAGPDKWLDFYVDSGLTEDRYIKAVEGKPSVDGFRVVHHAHQYIIPPGADDDPSMSRQQTLNEYAVGKAADVFPEGTGRLIKAGSKIRFNVHYHSIGEEIKDQISIGLILYPKGVVPKHVLNSQSTGRPLDLDIPPGAAEVRSDGYRGFSTPVKITSFQPHLHNRGKRECIEAIYPDGRQEMLNCAGFNFGWAIVYNYADDVAPILPAGSMLHVINWHDNSAANRGNPDPRSWVGDGNRTIDEMSFSWVNSYELTPEEYQAEVATRVKQRALSTSQQQ